MAKQWSRYKVDPGKYHYQAGQTAEILWNVAECGCGGSTVNIRNTATASLYNYTPVPAEPGRAGLLPGHRATPARAYGNRNFFFLFHQYFGVTGGGLAASIAVNGVQVTIPDSPDVPAALRGAVVNAPTMPWPGASPPALRRSARLRLGRRHQRRPGRPGLLARRRAATLRRPVGSTAPADRLRADPGRVRGRLPLRRSAGRRPAVPWGQGRAGDIVGWPATWPSTSA